MCLTLPNTDILSRRPLERNRVSLTRCKTLSWVWQGQG